MNAVPTVRTEELVDPANPSGGSWAVITPVLRMWHADDHGPLRALPLTLRNCEIVPSVESWSVAFLSRPGITS